MSTPSNGKTTAREYWCFISYRHSDNKKLTEEAGRNWASWLHHSIETYEVPVSLVGKDFGRGPIPPRLYPIFRDEDELPAGSNLSEPIEAALCNSKTLLVLCSPGAVQSEFVDKEIRGFKALHPDRPVLAAILRGAPNVVDLHDPTVVKKAGYAVSDECFPRALRCQVNEKRALLLDQPTEPIAADFRWRDREESWTNEQAMTLGLRVCGEFSNQEIKAHAAAHADRLRLMKFKILAGIMGVALDDLIKRSDAYQLAKARKRQRIIFATAALFALLAAVAVVLGLQARQKSAEATQQRNEAVLQRNEAGKQRDRAEEQTKLAQELATKEAEQRKLADEKKREAEAQREAANEQRKLADEQRAAAVAANEKLKVSLQEASRADHAAAEVQFRDGHWREGIAYLGRALRYDPDNLPARSLLWTSLLYSGQGKEGAMIAAMPFPSQSEIVPHQRRLRMDASGLVLAQVPEMLKGHQLRLLQPDGKTVQPFDSIKFASEAQIVDQGKTLLVATARYVDKKVELHRWDIATAKEIAPSISISREAMIGALSPDGQRLALLLGDNQGSGGVLLVNTINGDAVGKAISSAKFLNAIRFSESSNRLLIQWGGNTMGFDKLEVLDARDGKRVCPLLLGNKVLASCDISPDGRYVAASTLSYPHTMMEVWNAESGTQAGAFGAEMIGDPFFNKNSNLLAFHNRKTDADRIHIMRLDDRRHWIDQKSVWTQVRGRKDYMPLQIKDLVFDASGKRLAVCTVHSSNGVEPSGVSFWNTDTGERIGTTQLHPEGVLEACFSPAEDRLVTMGVDGTLRVWSLGTATAEPVMVIHSGGRSDTWGACFWSASGGNLITQADDSGSAKIWKASSGALLAEAGTKTGRKSVISPDHRWLAVEVAAQSCALVNAETATLEAGRITLDHDFNVFGFTPKSDELLVWNMTKKLRRWSVPDLHEASTAIDVGDYPGAYRSEEITHLPASPLALLNARTEGIQTLVDLAGGHFTSIKHAVFTADGRHCVETIIGSSSQQLQIWSGAREKMVGGRIQGRLGPLDPAGRLALVDTDNALEIWNLNDATLRTTLRKAAVVGFDSEGRRIALLGGHQSGGKGTWLTIANPDDGTLIASAKISEAVLETNRLVWSTDGRLLAIATDAGVRIFDPVSCLPMTPWLPMQNGIRMRDNFDVINTSTHWTDLAITPNGKRVCGRTGYGAAIWELAVPDGNLPAWLQDFVTATSGYNFAKAGTLQDIAPDERVHLAQRLADASRDPAWTKVTSLWLHTPPPTKP